MKGLAQVGTLEIYSRACPITVKKALSKVKGVTKAEVSFEHKQAVVTFEDTQTSAGKLIEATTNAGYPSTLVETETP